MEIVTIQPSLEQCAQAGWQGYDVVLKQVVTRDFLGQLAAKGHLDYYPQLRQPFFRVLHPQWVIRGVVGQDKLRVGFPQGDERTEHLRKIRWLLEDETVPSTPGER